MLWHNIFLYPFSLTLFPRLLHRKLVWRFAQSIASSLIAIFIILDYKLCSENAFSSTEAAATAIMYDMFIVTVTEHFVAKKQREI